MKISVIKRRLQVNARNDLNDLQGEIKLMFRPLRFVRPAAASANWKISGDRWPKVTIEVVRPDSGAGVFQLIFLFPLRQSVMWSLRVRIVCPWRAWLGEVSLPSTSGGQQRGDIAVLTVKLKR